MSKVLDFLWCGDLHLGGLLAYYAKDHLQPIFNMLAEVEEYALDHGIRHVFQGGDVCDDPAPEQEILRRLMTWLAGSSLSWYFLLGNHDFSETKRISLELSAWLTRLKNWQHVQFYTKPRQEMIAGIPFCFLPWPYDRALPCKLPQVVLAHIGVVGCKADNGWVIKPSAGVEITVGADFWLIGHLHRHQKIKRGEYGGTLYQVRFGEPLPKGFLHCRAILENKKLTVETQFIQVQPPHELHTVVIKNAEDLRALPTEKHYCFKLLIQEGVDVPPRLIAEDYRILSVGGWKSKKELAALQEGSIDLSDDEELTEVNHKSILPGYLRRKRELTRAQIDRAVGIVAHIEQFLKGKSR